MVTTEPNSDEILNELQGKDLSEVITGETQTSEAPEVTEEAPKEEPKESGKKSNFQKAMEKKNTIIAEKDELIASKDQRIAELEQKIKEAQESEDFDDMDAKEEQISNLKSDISYERNRRNELQSEKVRMKNGLLDGMMNEMNISQESQSAIREMAKQDAYKNLEPEDVISIYNGKVGLEYDQQEIHKKAGGTSVLGDNRMRSSESIDTMDSKAMEQELTRQIMNGKTPF